MESSWPSILSKTAAGQGRGQSVDFGNSSGIEHGRDFISALATKRVTATAIFSTLHDGNQVQLQQAFALAKMKSTAEVAFEAERNPAVHNVYYLTVTADTPEQARADLATLADAIKAAFPSAERNLMVSLNNSTRPVPNELSRRTSVGVQAFVVLMMGESRS